MDIRPQSTERKQKNMTTETICGMKHSNLIQRLHRPRIKSDSLLSKIDFAFGGGLLHGGLSDKVMDVLRSILQFDYMGSSEFEWGAVPKALAALVDDGERLKAFPITVVTSEMSVTIPKYTGKSITDKVYILCRPEHGTEVKARILRWAYTNTQASEYYTKEYVGLNESLRELDPGDLSHNVGWFELDNGFFFFTDKEMWEKICDLLSVPHAD